MSQKEKLEPPTEKNDSQKNENDSQNEKQNSQANALWAEMGFGSECPESVNEEEADFLLTPTRTRWLLTVPAVVMSLIFLIEACTVTRKASPQFDELDTDKKGKVSVGEVVDELKHHPKTYTVAKGTPQNWRNVLDDDQWRGAPWSQDFKDIALRENLQPTDEQRVRFKALYDHEYVYFAVDVKLAIGDDLTVSTSATDKPLHQTDSIVELFIDPDQNGRYYSQFQVNAAKLACIRRFKASKIEYVAFDPSNYQCRKHQKPEVEVKFIDGDLVQAPARYLVIVRSQIKDVLMQHGVSRNSVVSPGDHWRFQVNRQLVRTNHGESPYHWTWSPATVFDAEDSKYKQKREIHGVTSLHVPATYGYLVFGDADGKIPQTGRFTEEGYDKAWLVLHAATTGYLTALKTKYQNENDPDVIELVENKLKALFRNEKTDFFNEVGHKFEAEDPWRLEVSDLPDKNKPAYWIAKVGQIHPLTVARKRAPQEPDGKIE